MMTRRKSEPVALGQLLSPAKDLHPDPLISQGDLLKLCPGLYPMLITRWRRERGFPAPIQHGKYGLRGLVAWLWGQRVELEKQLDDAGGPGGQKDPVRHELDMIRLERERLALAEDKKELGSIAEFEAAEAQRVQMAISVLGSIPDRLIAEGLLRDDARNRFLELLGEFVDTIQTRTRNGEY